MTTPPPGWYSDQANPQQLRWWNGAAWTAHTQPSQPQPPPPAQHQAGHPQQPYGVQPGPYATPQPQAQPQPQATPPAPQPQAPQPPGNRPPQPVPASQHQPPAQPPQAYAGGGQPGAQPQPQAPAPPQPLAPHQQAMAGFAGAGHAGPPAAAASPAGPGGQPGSNPLFTEQAVLVAQEDKVFNVQVAGYKIYDQAKNVIGRFSQVDTSGVAKAARILSKSARAWMTNNYELRDANGNLVAAVSQPQDLKSTVKPKFEVTGPNSEPVGRIESEKVVGKITFGFHANGMRIGGFEVEKWYSRRYVVTDQSGTQVAEYLKRSYSEIGFREMFTQSDSYVLMRPHPLPEPLGLLTLIGLLALDAGFFERPD